MPKLFINKEVGCLIYSLLEKEAYLATTMGFDEYTILVKSILQLLKKANLDDKSTDFPIRPTILAEHVTLVEILVKLKGYCNPSGLLLIDSAIKRLRVLSIVTTVSYLEFKQFDQYRKSLNKPK